MAAAVNLRVPVAQNSRLLVAAEITEIEGRGGDAQVVLSLATQIQESWLREMFPDDFEERTMHIFDKSQNRVVVRPGEDLSRSCHRLSRSRRGALS